MPGKIRLRQSRDVEAFRCIGSACEDTCCADWGVAVDRKTYKKYQACGDPELQPLLNQYVTLNTSQRTDVDYARISFVDNHCPLLSEGLCGIQLKLGEAYLSNTCASYPRSSLVVDGAVERTLNLSCPEAARLVLLDARPFEWKELSVEPDDRYDGTGQGDPQPYYQEVRELFLRTLSTVSYARRQRLAIMGQLAEELNAMQDKRGAAAGDFITRSLSRLESRTFETGNTTGVQTTVRLEIILDLIVARIGSDFTTHRLLECYREFMEGIGWGPESTMEELASRYAEAQRQWYAPFMSQHEFMLDNFLSNYLARKLFPYGQRDSMENAVRQEYLLLVTHYATIRTLLVGMAAFHRAGFGAGQVVKLVQAYAKAFLHSTAYPEKALQILAGNGIGTAEQALVLLQD